MFVEGSAGGDTHPSLKGSRIRRFREKDLDGDSSANIYGFGNSLTEENSHPTEGPFSTILSLYGFGERREMDRKQRENNARHDKSQISERIWPIDKTKSCSRCSLTASGLMEEARFLSCLLDRLLCLQGTVLILISSTAASNILHNLRVTGCPTIRYPRFFLNTGSLFTIQSNPPECVRCAQIECRRRDWLKEQQLLTRWLR